LVREHATKHGSETRAVLIKFLTGDVAGNRYYTTDAAEVQKIVSALEASVRIERMVTSPAEVKAEGDQVELLDRDGDRLTFFNVPPGSIEEGWGPAFAEVFAAAQKKSSRR
jgi:hypothetical protein